MPHGKLLGSRPRAKPGCLPARWEPTSRRAVTAVSGTVSLFCGLSSSSATWPKRITEVMQNSSSVSLETKEIIPITLDGLVSLACNHYVQHLKFSANSCSKESKVTAGFTAKLDWIELPLPRHSGIPAPSSWHLSVGTEGTSSTQHETPRQQGSQIGGRPLATDQGAAHSRLGCCKVSWCHGCPWECTRLQHLSIGWANIHTE